jgi:uncharacterized protein (TIGR02266 family)
MAEATKGERPILNRRDTRRAPAVLKVTYAAGTDLKPDYSENISREGLFIATAVPYAVGDVIEFALSFPRLLEPLPLRCRVCWRRGGTEGGPPPGIGLQLISEDPQVREAFGQLADMVTQAAGPIGLAADLQSETRPQLTVGRGFRMLICEDNPHARQMFVYGLRKLAMLPGGDNLLIDVVECKDGRDAWNHLCESNDFDLVMLDMCMPVRSGLELIELIRGNKMMDGVPVIAMSGDPDERSAALSAGADIFLAKPLQLTDILVTVRALLAM